MTFLTKNAGISGNTMDAFALSTGSYVALLDHNDTLAPFALDAAARVLASDPETDLLHSNEDKRAGTTDGPVASRQAHLFSWQLHHSRPAPAVAVRRHVDRRKGVGGISPAPVLCSCSGSCSGSRDGWPNGSETVSKAWRNRWYTVGLSGTPDTVR